MNTPAGATPRKWVLVVDDDRRVREPIVEGLRMAGYAVIAAGPGPVALQLLVHLLPDLILLDFDMPGMSGREFLDALAARTPWRDIPVLVLSAHPLEEAAPERARVADVMVKPICHEVLLAQVGQILG